MKMSKNKTLSERFIEGYNSLETRVSAADYMAWQRWRYWKKLKDAGLTIHATKEIDEGNENMQKITEGERMLHIFEDLPDDLKLDVLDYIRWIKMVDDKDDEIDIIWAEEHYNEEYDEKDLVSWEELKAERVSV